ncbi:MAG: preprotein translocase subunit YajC [Candidatus Aminicenantes bacterium]|jgi:preprotein translocase subunit YajC|nr:preprotein translocase subunit YajC [Candidatus Aminicenantes bacterium]
MSFLTMMSISEQQAAPGQPNLLVGLLPFILVFVVFYLLIILPQRKKQKQHQQMVENLRPGDRIITSGGIFGTVMDVHPDRIELKIAANVKVDILKSAVAIILSEKEKTEGKESS